MDSRYATWATRWRVPLGFVMGGAFIFLAQPTLQLLCIGGGIAFLGLVLRALAAGHLVKGVELATSGPYRFTRNPLYLGSFVMGMGFAVASSSWILMLAFLIFFLVVYWPVMRREEHFLREKFGEAYNQYAASTSLFIPAFRVGTRVELKSSTTKTFRWEQYRKNHEYEAALGYIAGLVFLAVKLQLR